MDEEKNNSEENLDTMMQENQASSNRPQSSGGSGVGNRIKNKIKDKAQKDVSKKAVKKAVMMALSYVIAYGIIFLIALVVLIGVAMFFVTMPGMLMEKLKALGKAIGDAWASWFGGDDTARVDKKQVYEVMDYIEQMGYGLKEHGFLTHYLTKEDLDSDDGRVYLTEVIRDEDGNVTDTKKSDVTHEDFRKDDDKEEAIFDDKQGVFRSSNSDLIIAGCSDFIMQYIISDNYMYTIRNFNVSTGDKWWLAVFEHIASIFSDNMDNRRGMILLLHENGEIGQVRRNGNTEDAYDSNLFDKIELNTEKRTLKIRRGIFNTAEIEYDLDGWTGRYGMPLEFLLSIHAATLMPDLAYDMTQNFDTTVRILLHESDKNSISANYKTERGAIISSSQVNDVMDGKFLGMIDFPGLTDEEAAKVINLGIIPPDFKSSTCTCEFADGQSYTWNGTPVTKKNDKYYYTNESGEEVEVPEENYGNIIVSASGQVTKAHGDCKKYIDEVWKVMESQSQESFKTYYPYIDSVRNHWYRDVYFVVPADSDLSFVRYDHNYEALMRERWTKYEMWTGDDPDLPSKALIGKYKLYKATLDSEGNYTESSNPETDPDIYTTYDETRNQGDDVSVKYVKKAETIDLASEYEDLYWNAGDGYYTAYDIDTDANNSSARMYTDEEIEEDREKNRLRAIAKEHIYADLTLDAAKQTGDGIRTETNSEIKKMFLMNRYFRYDGNMDRAEQITQLRETYGIPYGALNTRTVTVNNSHYVENLSKEEYDNLLNSSIEYSTKSGEPTTVTVKDVSGSVQITQDSLNAFSMLENTHTLDADYIYRDFKELIVELGFFTKEELMDAIPRVMEFPVPEIGSSGYPKRNIDKTEVEKGTMIHSKGDIKASDKLTFAKFLAENDVEDKDEKGDALYGPDDVETKVQDNMGDAPKADGGSTSSNSKGNEGFMQVAIEVAGKVKTRHYIGAGTGEYTFPIENYHTDKICENGICQYNCAGVHTNGDSLSCSSFVSECLYQSGYEEQIEGGQKIFATGDALSALVQFLSAGIEVKAFLCMEDCCNSEIESTCQSNNIELIKMTPTSYEDKMEPGDICFRAIEGNEHTYIYADKDSGTSFKELGFPELCYGSESDNYYTSETTDSLKCAVRIFDVEKKDDGSKYEGYLGNEAVVAPMTGVLLEYGTYTDEDKITNKAENGEEKETYEYRENVDLNYPKESTLLEGVLSDENNEVSSQKENDAVEKEKVVDKVGYAKMLVLDEKSLKILEAGSSSWESDQLLEVGETAYNFPDVSLTKEEDMEDWSLEKTTAYGFKEFAENYHDYGLSGFTIYIDGFVCELPDESGGEVDGEEGENDERNKYKTRYDGEDLSLDVFKEQDISRLEGEDPELDERIQSKYKAIDSMQLSSKSATERINAENVCKDKAFSVVSTGGLVFIKEGTVIGRTMSDIEANDVTKAGIKVRKNPQHEYEYYRKEKEKGLEYDENGKPFYDGDWVIGNYLRLMFYDKESELIENIEDYMKLDGTKEVSVNFNGLSPEEFMKRLESMSTPTLEEIERAAELNGLDKEYVKILLGTTFNEGYIDDPYLYYGWCSAITNNQVTYDQMRSWEASGGSYYSQEHILEGYNNAQDDDTVMKAVYLALTERNEYINECDGMISRDSTPSNYNCIYDSEVYNCRIYEIVH